MMLTLFCDASHCAKTRAAGWGAWAKRDGWEFGRIFGGPISGQPANSTEAELSSISSALSQLASAGDLSEVKTIVVQCDNLAALAALRALPNTAWSRSDDRRDSGGAIQRRKMSSIEKRSLATIGEAIGDRSIFLRHIKGHSSGTGRNWVNAQCDRVAKKYMRDLRSSIGSEAQA